MQRFFRTRQRLRRLVPRPLEKAARRLLGGRPAGRVSHALTLDEGWYCNRYPDVVPDLERGRVASVLEHYLEVGSAQARDPHPAFAEKWYRERYPDAAQAIDEGRYLTGYQHFLTKGIFEDRQPHARYDESHYRNLYDDVDAAVRQGIYDYGYLHLITDGLAEGRRWKSEDRHPTLRAAAARLAGHRLEELLQGDRILDFEPPESPLVSILVVLFNRAELTLGCFEALRRIRGIDFELIVVDNASTDATPRLVARLRGAVRLRNPENLGFTRAVNQAAAEARGTYLLLLNNDAEILPEALSAAVERLQDPEAGAVGGRVIGLDGRLEEAGSIVWRDATTIGYGRGDDPASGAYLFAREVDYCSGVFLLTRRQTFEELGGLDLAFAPAYYEETDFCFRLRRRGLKILYEPRSVIIHFGSASLRDDTHLSRMLARNRSVFRQRYRDQLEAALEPDPTHLFVASHRRRYRGRILVLDNHLPLESQGAGSPRVQEILRGLCELGFFVTFFATQASPPGWQKVRRELPETGLELIGHLGWPGFEKFWDPRRGSYDVLIVSRRNNFHKLLERGFDPKNQDLRLIYDAESVTAARRAAQLELLGSEAPVESAVSVEEEIDIASAAPEIWAVSEREAELLASHLDRAEQPRPRISVISHGVEAAPGEETFEARQGILFVGRLVEDWNPNVDGLAWYLREILPRIVKRLGAVPMAVVGERGTIDLPQPAGVRFLGPVEDLAPLYDRHRILVAPTRFAAGIPIKILGAAAHGLPVVATSLLAGQLGWSDGRELLDGGDNHPERFADRVVELYSRPDLWNDVRRNALRRVGQDHSREALRRALARALDIEQTEGAESPSPEVVLAGQRSRR